MVRLIQTEPNFGPEVVVYSDMQRLYILIIFISSFVAAQAQSTQDYDVDSQRQELAKTVQIFPNPAVDFVHVRFDQISARNMKVTLHNIIGNTVPIETEMIDEHEFRVRVKELDSGYYLLALKDEENKFQGTYKFLKR